MSLFDRLQGNAQNKIAKEKEESTAFLEINKDKEGVTTLPEGIQYTVLQEGTGAQPTLHSKVKAHYKGSLLNGTEFDSSYKRGAPFTAKISALVKGWQIVLPMMPVGSIWRLWIPSEYGYGDAGAGGSIPGGALLVFDIELLEILD